MHPRRLCFTLLDHLATTLDRQSRDGYLRPSRALSLASRWSSSGRLRVSALSVEEKRAHAGFPQHATPWTARKTATGESATAPACKEERCTIGRTHRSHQPPQNIRLTWAEYAHTAQRVFGPLDCIPETKWVCAWRIASAFARRRRPSVISVPVRRTSRRP